MENVSLASEVSQNTTEDNDLALYLANIRDVALKITYIIIGTVGVVDNLFVILVFAMFIKITDKVILVIKHVLITVCTVWCTTVLLFFASCHMLRF